MNPAAAVRGPTHVVKAGKTPVLDGSEWRWLLDAIPADTVRDRRDRALIGQADAWRMIRRWAKSAGIKAPIGCHTFRATGIAAYLENGGTLEHAQAMAAHESPHTTKLYDRTKERLTLDEIERIRF
jgi:integrase